MPADAERLATDFRDLYERTYGEGSSWAGVPTTMVNYSVTVLARHRAVAGLLAHGLPTVDGDPKPETVVAVLTGHGLKDPDTALGKAPAVISCENDLSAVERAVFSD